MTTSMTSAANYPTATSWQPNWRGSSAVTTTKVASARPQTTTVREGENLSDIAKRELGNRNLWKLIWSANKASLPDPDVLRVGMTLQIPVVTARN